MLERVRHPLSALALAILLTVPWLLLRGTGAVESISPIAVVVTAGVSVIGAAFVLTWGAEAAEGDVPRSFALAVLAIIAVAPEYAVDALYAWEAGQFAGTERGIEAGNLAVANMTGANRILIGLGWSLIALYAVYRTMRAGTDVESREGFLAGGVELDPRISIEIVFLSAATLYAFLIPLNGGIGAVDALVLVGLYAGYIAVILRGEAGSEVHLGVPGYLQGLSRARRVVGILLMFAFAGAVILLAVKPFARALETLGPQFGVSSFFMIQWVAPLASESPELIACAYLVQKLRTTASFNALISSKLNQWTLLIGTLVVVYSISLGSYDVLQFNQKQAGEIWITAAQSFFAVTLLVDFRISVREALALLALFLLQFYPPFQQYEGLLAFSALYVVLGVAVLWYRRDRLLGVVREARRQASAETEDAAPAHAADGGFE